MWKKKFHLWTEASVCTGKFHPAFPDALLLQGFQTCIAKPHGHVSLLFAINILKYISLPAVFNRQSTSTILLRGLLLRLKLPGKIDLMSDLFFSRLYFTYRRLNKNETFCILFSQQLFFGKAHTCFKQFVRQPTFSQHFFQHNIFRKCVTKDESTTNPLFSHSASHPQFYCCRQFSESGGFV